MHKKNIITVIIFAAFLNIFLSAACFSQQEEKIKYSIKITDASICRGVMERIPVESGEIFSYDVKKLFCFTRVVGAQTDTAVIHEWYFKEKMVSRVVLPVRSGNWRTYSSKTINPKDTGQWMVKILSQDALLLKKIYFVIN